MNRLLVSALLLALAVPAVALAEPPAAPPGAGLIDAPPPPPMDDPGVNHAASAPTAASDAAGAVAPAPVDDSLAPLPKPDTRLVRDKASRTPNAAELRARDAASDVTVRKEGNDTIEEYRSNGRLWKVRVMPQNGPVQTWMDLDNDGRLDNDPKQGPVSPVYYTLYQWD